MAINNTINNGILTLITKGAKLGTEYNNVYIGLLTQLPSDANHMSGVDKDWIEVDFNLEDQGTGEDVRTGYGRYRLAYSTTGAGTTTHYYSQGAHNIRVISNDYPRWDSTDGACIVVNDGDDMMFPNIVETLDEKFPSKSWTVEGFGLFSTENGDEMIAYGKLVGDNGDDTTVTLRAGSVPIFYKDSFKLMLKDGDTAVARGGN